MVALSDAGKSNAEIAKKTGISEHTIRREIEREAIAREVEPTIDPSTLSISAQQKLNIAIKQATRKLEAEIEHRVRAENMKFLQKQLDQHNQNAKHYEAVLKARKGFVDKTAFNLIWSCLHSDSRKSVSEDRLNKAFHLWTSLEKVALSEKDSPTKSSGLPTTAEELLKRKAEYAAQRKKKGAADGMERRG